MRSPKGILIKSYTAFLSLIPQGARLLLTMIIIRHSGLHQFGILNLRLHRSSPTKND